MPRHRPDRVRQVHAPAARSTASSPTSAAGPSSDGWSSTGGTRSANPPRELADVVGFVGQDPSAGFVTDNVEEELAYAMEHLAIDPAVMRKRVEEILDLLGLADLRDRSLRTLSGGQRQRVAIGAALTAHPRVLVLDEPTSALDPTAAEEVIAAITRLVHDLGMTVVLAEHRLERVIQHADRVILVDGQGGVRSGPPATVLADVADVPPIVGLARLAGWDPAPLSIRDARRLAPGLRDRLADRVPGRPTSRRRARIRDRPADPRWRPAASPSRTARWSPCARWT